MKTLLQAMMEFFRALKPTTRLQQHWLSLGITLVIVGIVMDILGLDCP